MVSSIPGLREAIPPMKEIQCVEGALARTVVNGSVENETFFSTCEFANTWSASFPESDEPVAVPVTGSGPSGTIYLVQTKERFGDLCLSPASGVARAGTILAGEWCGRLRSWFDNPERIGGEFKDYLFVWRKPASGTGHGN